MYRVTKTYGHERGLSCCFRQWRTDSHCRFLHGYALAFSITFEAETLNIQNWVIDFGSLQPVRSFLEDTFDHTLAVAADDPDLAILHSLGITRLASIRTFNDGVGCELFAKYVAEWVIGWLAVTGRSNVRLVSVECREHSGNTATYFPGAV